MARGGIARRLIELILSIVGGVRGSLGLVDHRSLRGVRRDVGIERRLRRGDRQAHHPVAEEERLRRHLLGQPGHRDRRDRRDHPAVDPDDHLRHRRAAVGAAAVPGRLRARHPDRHCAGDLRLFLRAREEHPGQPRRRAGARSRHRSRIRSGRCFAPVVILGGIYGGLFTPTEAAGVACIYAIVVSMFVYREITWRDLWAITVESAMLSAQVLIIVSAAGAFAWLITTSGYPAKLVGVRRRAAAHALDAAAGHQHHPAVRRQHAGAAGGDPAAHAAAHADRLRGGRRIRSISASSSPSTWRSACSCRRSA